MRTTIDLDQAVLRQVRKHALASHHTMSQVVEEALRRYLRQPTDTKRPGFTLITGGQRDGVAPTWDQIKRQMNDEDDTKARRVADTDAAP